MNLLENIETEAYQTLSEIKKSLLVADTYSLDLETGGLDFTKDRITHISFATDTEKWSLRLRSFDQDSRIAINIIADSLREVFGDESKLVVLHNSKFDNLFLYQNGVFIKNKMACTMVMSWLIDEDPQRYPHGLKELAKIELGVTMNTFAEATGLFASMEDYSAADPFYTLKLYRLFLPRLEKLGLLKDFWEIEMPILKILIDTEFRGVRIDGDQLKLLKAEAFEELEKLRKITHLLASVDAEQIRKLQVSLNEIAKKAKEDKKETEISSRQLAHLESLKLIPNIFEISSPAQCARVLFDDLKIGMKDVESKTSDNIYSERGAISKAVCKCGWEGKPKGIGQLAVVYCPVCGATATPIGIFSTDDDSLKKMAMDNYSIADSLLSYRAVNTRLNNFIKPLLDRYRESEIIHPQFVQIGTVSGRFASKNPNYQNLPRKGGIRKCFIARKGYKIIKSDYSQAELRLMAHMSQDPTMIHIYNNDGDIHQMTADACGLKGKEGRQVAKIINFSIVYRVSARRLQGQLALDSKQIVTLEEAEDYIKKYFAKYPCVKIFHKKVEDVCMARLASDGKFGWVTLLGGRLRRMDKDYLAGKETHYTAITQLINSVIQGGVADMIKFAMVNIQKTFIEKDWLDSSRNLWRANTSGQIHDEILAEAEDSIAEEVKHIVETKMYEAGTHFKIKVPMTTDAHVVDSLAK